MTPKNHRWRSQGEKRTIVVVYKPTTRILTYLKDMKHALTQALTQAYILARESS